MQWDLCTASGTLSPIGTDVRLRASVIWLGTRTGADGTATLAWSFFDRSLWLHERNKKNSHYPNYSGSRVFTNPIHWRRVPHSPPPDEKRQPIQQHEFKAAPFKPRGYETGIIQTEKKYCLDQYYFHEIDKRASEKREVRMWIWCFSWML